MIEEIVKQWDERKSVLEEWFKNNPQTEYDTYEKIVKSLFTRVIEGYKDTSIRKIDDGEYQGCQIFIIPENTYQPGIDQYVFTYADYGSCSGCDTLERIRSNGNWSDEKPTERQVKQYMTLALHLIQRTHRMLQHEMREENEWYYPDYID